MNILTMMYDTVVLFYATCHSDSHDSDSPSLVQTHPEFQSHWHFSCLIDLTIGFEPELWVTLIFNRIAGDTESGAPNQGWFYDGYVPWKYMLLS